MNDYKQRAQTLLRDSFTRLVLSHGSLDRRIVLGEYVSKEEYEWFVNKLCEPASERTNADVESLLSMVVHNPFFADLPAPISRLLCKHMTLERFRKGETIFEEGSQGQKFYVISQGAVVVLASTSDNPELHAVRQLYSGETFGERALLEENVRRSASVQAIAEVNEFLVIHRSSYRLVKEYVEHEDLKRIDFLKEKLVLPVFASLDDQSLRELCRQLQRETYPRGALILEQGRNRPPATAWFIVRGQCAVFKSLQSPVTQQRGLAKLHYGLSEFISAQHSGVGGDREITGNTSTIDPRQYPAAQGYSTSNTNIPEEDEKDDEEEGAHLRDEARPSSASSSVHSSTVPEHPFAHNHHRMVQIVSLGVGEVFGHFQVDCPKSPFTVVAETEVVVYRVGTAVLCGYLPPEAMKSLSEHLIGLDVNPSVLRQQVQREREWKRYKNEFVKAVIRDHELAVGQSKSRSGPGIPLPREVFPPRMYVRHEPNTELIEGLKGALVEHAINYGVTPQIMKDGYDGFRVRINGNNNNANSKSSHHVIGNASTSNTGVIGVSQSVPVLPRARPMEKSLSTATLLRAKYEQVESKIARSLSRTRMVTETPEDTVALCTQSLSWIIKHGKYNPVGLESTSSGITGTMGASDTQLSGANSTQSLDNHENGRKPRAAEKASRADEYLSAKNLRLSASRTALRLKESEMNARRPTLDSRSGRLAPSVGSEGGGTAKALSRSLTSAELSLSKKKSISPPRSAVMKRTGGAVTSQQWSRGGTSGSSIGNNNNDNSINNSNNARTSSGLKWRYTNSGGSGIEARGAGGGEGKLGRSSLGMTIDMFKDLETEMDYTMDRRRVHDAERTSTLFI